MSYPEVWPKELVFHFSRIEEHLREDFLEKVNNTTLPTEDSLGRFLHVIHQLESKLDDYIDYPEFLFFILQGLYFEGKNKLVIDYSSNYPTHPGFLVLKAKALTNLKQFDDIPELLSDAKRLAEASEPVLFLSAVANDVLFSYYSQSFSAIPEKLIQLENYYKQLIRFENSNPVYQKLLLQEYIQGNSVKIAMYRRKGELLRGANIGKDLIKEAKKVSNRFVLNRILNNTALCLIEIGRLKEGLELLEEAFAFSRILANEIRIASFANNIGFIHRQLGNLDEALSYFEVAITFSKRVANVPHIIVASETNIAHILLDFGKVEEALAKSKEAEKTIAASEVPIPPRIRIDLKLCQADIYESLDRFKDATNTLDLALAEIGEAKLTAEVAKVYLRKAHIAARQSNLGDASSLLENTLEIALRNNLFEIIINAKLQLAEIDLIRHRITGQEIQLEQALEKIEDTKQLCYEQEYKVVLVDVYILQGLLLSLAKKQKQGVKVLREAIELAKMINLPEKEEEAKRQLKEIKGGQKNLLVKVFTRMTKSIRSTFTFESVSKPKVVDTKIKALYIISKKSSLPIYEKHFDVEKKFDAGLLSGLLSAIRTMGETLLDSKEGGLKLIDHGDVAIMLETLKDTVFALVLTRETFLTREKLRDFAENYTQSGVLQKEDSGIVFNKEEDKEAIDILVSKCFADL